MSIRSDDFIILSKHSLTESALETSHLKAIARPEIFLAASFALFSSISNRYTHFAPCFENNLAISNPIPVAPPVIATILPLNSNILLNILLTIYNLLRSINCNLRIYYEKIKLTWRSLLLSSVCVFVIWIERERERGSQREREGSLDIYG
jgi:hypothetical protein